MKKFLKYFQKIAEALVMDLSVKALKVSLIFIINFVCSLKSSEILALLGLIFNAFVTFQAARTLRKFDDPFDNSKFS